MMNFVMFLIGLMLGSFVGVALMCLMQINRLNEHTQYQQKEEHHETDD